ncbi:MAG: TlpA family protein disulfide reductase [Opitutaceae bacterium]|nr:TlpA family protein disulfide reductase [Opitutaceae bacterium]
MAEKRQHASPTAELFAPEFEELDTLLKLHPEKSNEMASLVMVKAYIHIEVLHDEETGRKLLLELKAGYPGTETAVMADRVLDYLTPEGKLKFATQVAEQAARAKEREEKIARLVGKPAPALHFAWSSRTGLKTLDDLKGRVVVLDFFATWCGPCIGSFPRVREEVAHFWDSPVTFLGVTSLQGKVHHVESKPIDCSRDPEREMGLMPVFMKKHGITWDVAFSEEKVFNPDYAVGGIPFVAILAPDGTVRHAGLNPNDPNADLVARVEAILREFNLPMPTAKD